MAQTWQVADRIFMHWRARAKRPDLPLWALIDCAEGRLAGDEFVDVAIRSPEVLPGRSRLAQQLDACPSQLVHGRGQVADGEADNRAGSEVLLARITAAENLGMPAVRKLEDPEIRFRMHQPEAENMLVEVCQFTAAACSRAAPSKARDLHACQYRHDQGSARASQERILFCRDRGFRVGCLSPPAGAALGGTRLLLAIWRRRRRSRPTPDGTPDGLRRLAAW